MKDTRISQPQLFATLRGKDVYQLGKVERLYIEVGGGFSIYKISKDAPLGLPLFPPADEEIISSCEKAGELKACTRCGLTVKSTNREACQNCNSPEFADAIFKIIL